MKVWIITSGEYSDYHIDTVCLDEKVARDYVRKWKACEKEAGEESLAYDQPRVEEYEVSDALPEPTIVWSASGSDKKGLGDIWVGADIQTKPGPQRPKRTETQSEYFGHRVIAKCADRSAAIKSVKDRLASIIATPEDDARQPYLPYYPPPQE